MPMIQKINKQDPAISPIAALKFLFRHSVMQDTSSGNDVAIAKNNAPAKVAHRFKRSANSSVT